jgi:hypothetical protein
MLALFTPAGIEEAFRSISVPAEHLGLPEKASTHSNTDPEATARRLSDPGIRLLAPDEVASQISPDYDPHLTAGKGVTFASWHQARPIPSHSDPEHRKDCVKPPPCSVAKGDARSGLYALAAACNRISADRS